jgi:hypothetical protein
MNLGDLIASLEQEETGESMLAALGDLVLFSQVRTMGEAYGESVGAYVATSARRFAASAGDETWLSMVGAMERAPEPGQTALQRMLRWALAEDARELAGHSAKPAHACTCGGGGCAG